MRVDGERVRPRCILVADAGALSLEVREDGAARALESGCGVPAQKMVRFGRLVPRERERRRDVALELVERLGRELEAAGLLPTERPAPPPSGPRLKDGER